jgi:hypothetical protein
MQCNTIQCYAILQYTTASLLIKRTFIFILLEQYKLKDYCDNIFTIWTCNKTPPRIPFDVFSGGGQIA